MGWSDNRRVANVRPDVSAAEALEPRLLLFANTPQDALAPEHGFACGCPGCRAGAPATLPVALEPLALSLEPAAITPAAAGSPLSALPQLSSLPGAPANLYLDFDGDVARTWGAYSVPPTPAHDYDGDPTSFNWLELETITEIWDRVADAFAPFNLNVTTVNPGADNVAGKTLRVVLGGNGQWTGQNIGGTAYRGSFKSTQNWVYGFQYSPQQMAVIAAHEAGHGFELMHQSSHDGGYDEYRDFDGPVGAIMAGSYNARSLWWRGATNTPTSIQDDMAVIAGPINGFGYRGDDYGNTPAAAAPLSFAAGAASTAGILHHHDDQDWFAFTWAGGALTAHATGGRHGNQLNPRLVLTDNAGNVLQTRAAADVGEVLTATLAAGTYRIGVTAQQHPDGSTNTTYGEAGRYTLRLAAGTDLQIPFLGAPMPISAAERTQIEIEDYDFGGPGVAYADSDQFVGREYRGGELVDLTFNRHEGYYSPGFLTDPGDWMEYTIDVATPGTYSVVMRAGGPGGSTFRFDVDGIDASGPISLPNTGGRDLLATHVHNYLTLPAGRHVLRLTMVSRDTSDTGPRPLLPSFNFFEIVPAGAGGQSAFGTGGAAHAVGATIEAENFDAGGAQIGHHDTSTDNTGGAYRSAEAVDVFANAAGGFRVADTHAGEWMEYTFSAPSAGTYDFELRAAAAGSGASISIELDGVILPQSLAIPDTGAPEAMQTLALRGLTLAAGSHVLRLNVDSITTAGSGPAFDWLRLVAAPKPALTLIATDPQAVAGDDDGEFTVTRSGPTTVELFVNYSVTGTATNGNDYGTLYGAVIIPAGQSSTTVRVNAWGGNATGNETVTLTLTPSAYYSVAAPSSDTVTIYLTTPPPPQSPYTGSPFAVGATPITIQAEHYDKGGQGVSYNDSDSSNGGATAFRNTEGVDLKLLANSTTNYRVNNTFAGEWVEYSINVATAGTYNLEFRVSSKGSNGKFHAELRHPGTDALTANLTGAVTAPNTGSNDVWQTLVRQVTLPAGQHVLRLAFDANSTYGSIASFDWMKVSAVAAQPPAGGTVITNTATYVRGGASAAINFGSSNDLIVKRADSAEKTRETYLKFDLGNISSIPTNATLRVYGRLSDTSNASLVTSLYSATNTSWTEAGLTWNNKPAAGTTSRGAFTVSGTTAAWYAINLTTFLRNELAAGRKVVTLVLKNNSTSSAFSIIASDETTNGPRITIT